jgi:hypothetical protein
MRPSCNRRSSEVVVALLEHSDATAPTLDPAGWGQSDVRRVVVRLMDGEVLQVGAAPNRDGALALARSIVAELERPAGEWPLVGDRLVRPESVISVDVLHL